MSNPTTLGSHARGLAAPELVCLQDPFPHHATIRRCGISTTCALTFDKKRLALRRQRP